MTLHPEASDSLQNFIVDLAVWLFGEWAAVEAVSSTEETTSVAERIHSPLWDGTLESMQRSMPWNGRQSSTLLMALLYWHCLSFFCHRQGVPQKLWPQPLPCYQRSRWYGDNHAVYLSRPTDATAVTGDGSDTRRSGSQGPRCRSWPRTQDHHLHRRILWRATTRRRRGWEGWVSPNPRSRKPLKRWTHCYPTAWRRAKVYHTRQTFNVFNSCIFTHSISTANAAIDKDDRVDPDTTANIDRCCLRHQLCRGDHYQQYWSMMVLHHLPAQSRRS